MNFPDISTMRLALAIVGTLILTFGSASAMDLKKFEWKRGKDTSVVEENIIECMIDFGWMVMDDFWNINDISECIDQDATQVQKLVMEL